ncbi:MAG: hypothetical protein B6D61_06740 [Bacteroidetes bacterium 4484_249]|nr:MAG: hypothetical protein B6D61_06740 [Bacteroidetes bacterium 4484_249]
MKKYTRILFFTATIVVFLFFSHKLFAKFVDNEEVYRADTNQVLQLFDSIKDNIYSFNKSMQLADSCFELSKRANYQYGIAETNSFIGKIYFHKGEFDSALFYFNKALIQFKDLKDIKKIIDLHNYIGVTLYIHGKFNPAIAIFEKGLHMSDSINNLEMIADFANKLGACYEELGFYTKSVKILVRALEASRSSNDKQGEAHILNNIGILFQNLKNYEKASDYYHKAQQIFSDLNDPQGLSDIQNNFGDLFYLEENYQKAIEYFKNALEYSKELEDDYGVALILNNIGGCYTMLQNFELAGEYLEKALKLAEQINYHEIIASGLANLGNIQMEKRNYASAIDFGERSLKEAKNISAISDEIVAYELLYKSYSALNRFDKAFEYLNNYQQLTDSINLVEQNNQIHEIEAKYELEKKEQEIEILKREKEVERLLQKYLLGVIIIGTLLIIALLFLYFNIRRTKKVLEKSENELKLANNTKERILSIIGHDMLSPIAANKEITDLIIKEKNNLSIQDIIKFLTPLKPVLDTTYYMAENLLFWGRLQRKKISFKPVVGPLKPIIDSCFSLFEFHANSKAITFQFEGDDTIQAFFDTDQITIVIRNLISNAVKFSGKKGVVSVSLISKNNHAIITVSDTGIGIPEDDLATLFDFNSKHESRFGTNNEKGTGLGLVIIKDFVNKNNGIVWVESKEKKGSKFSFTLPLTSGKTHR